MGAVQHVLVMSSDDIFASLLERELGKGFELHAAASGAAASMLLDAYTYSCVVVDGSVSEVDLQRLNVPVVDIESDRPGVDLIRRVAERVREAIR